jgi:transcriptional regulator with XRE-family HTH domain
MESFGSLIRKLREDKGHSLRQVADYLSLDLAILSKYETGNRKPPREVVIRLARYFNCSKEKLMVTWLSDRILDQVQDEELASEAMKVAEERIRYNKTNRK